jgi:hypothetical protein
MQEVSLHGRKRKFSMNFLRDQKINRIEEFSKKHKNIYERKHQKERDIPKRTLRTSGNVASVTTFEADGLDNMCSISIVLVVPVSSSGVINSTKITRIGGHGGKTTRTACGVVPNHP